MSDKKTFEQSTKDIDDTDLEYAAKKGNRKINLFGDNPPSALAKFWTDIKLMIGLISDYAKGDYKEVPWKVITAVTGAVIYFVSPIDVILDLIPGLGYLDDAVVFKLALDLAGSDLQKYAVWKNDVDQASKQET